MRSRLRGDIVSRSSSPTFLRLREMSRMPPGSPVWESRTSRGTGFSSRMLLAISIDSSKVIRGMDALLRLPFHQPERLDWFRRIVDVPLIARKSSVDIVAI